MGQTFSEEQQVWKMVLACTKQAARKLPRPVRKPTYPDWLIVAMYFWANRHNQSMLWACQRQHYGRLFRPRKLPSYTRFTRRIADDRCQQILQSVQEQIAPVHQPASSYLMDGKPMLVSPVSKDRQAGRCRVCGTWCKGYKLHALCTAEVGLIIRWAVTPLNTGECPVGELLCQGLPPQANDALVMADSNYDDRDIGKTLASANCAYLTPLKGAAEHPVTLRQMGPVRRELLRLWKHRPQLARLALRGRNKIENVFSQLCDLTRLPAFVRTLARVRRWAGVKIILYNAKVCVRQANQRTQAAA